MAYEQFLAHAITRESEVQSSEESRGEYLASNKLQGEMGQNIDISSSEAVLADIENYLNGLSDLDASEEVEQWRMNEESDEAIDEARDLLYRVIQSAKCNAVDKYKMFYEVRLILDDH